MSRRFLLSVVLVLSCSSIYAQTVEAPQLKSGDTWVYSRTVQKGTRGWDNKVMVSTLEQVEGDRVLVSTTQQGSTQPPSEHSFGLDWSRSRDVDGKQTVVNQPLNFPLKVGKKWEIDYAETNPPSNKAHSSETVHETYTVTGWEDVQVPAGTFKALKIEAEGQWTAVMARAVVGGTRTVATAEGVAAVSQANRIDPRAISGRLYKAFWYVPTDKRFVKSVEEYYNSNDVLSERDAEELVSFKPGG
ncbi:hypothetical protein [Rhodanobacter sp. DHG33]|uniref:hypothetical protein n=1 Tax=Rhodanobacter sp. DHG33 TaxID=2775921 RepID=UPI00177D7E77|nr:hypothetical protein [Rhodanobacter sp. DHG33]MBD8899589.1 hypothetical protein [Rhodanobacter sp. DHG33]